MRLTALVVLALLLTACGFQLRGSTEWPASLTRLHVDGAGLTPEVERHVIPALRRAGAATTTGERDPAATARLELVRVEDTRDIVAFGAGSRVRNYNLSYRIEYRLHLEPEQPPVGGSVVASRDIRVDPEEVTGAISDARRVNDELRSEAISALIRRLAAAG
jgi:LPS-assembly lipoprotein